MRQTGSLWARVWGVSSRWRELMSREQPGLGVQGLGNTEGSSYALYLGEPQGLKAEQGPGQVRSAVLHLSRLHGLCTAT